MSTIATVIDRSLRLLGQIGSGQNASTNEYADGLIALNALLDGWDNERTLCFATRTESLTLSASTTSYTIGPGGNLNTTRPVDIEAAWIVSGTISYPPCKKLTDAQYDAITTKGEASDWPIAFNYRPTMTTGTLYVWPPANGTQTLDLRTRTPLSAYSATTDTLSLPPGWEEALTFNLAVAWAPEFQIEPPPTVIDRARQSKASIKILNSKPVPGKTDLALMFNARRSNILTDQ